MPAEPQKALGLRGLTLQRSQPRHTNVQICACTTCCALASDVQWFADHSPW